MRTLTFGDRTISYDAGLDTINTEEATTASEFVLSDSSSERKVSVAKSESADSGVGADTLEIQDDNDQDDISETERRVIRPDDFAVRELLNFDEEEEDDYNESDTDDDDDARNRSKEARNPSLYNKKWRQAIVKDLTLRNNTGEGGQPLTRSDSLDRVLSAAGDKSEVKLSLREVGHIRRVLARAELEASHLEPEVKLEVEAGRVCGVCHAQRLGGGVIRGRGLACELCRVMACSACVEVTARVSRDTEYHIQDIPRHLLAPEVTTEDVVTRHNCAGSAPSSPQASRRSDEVTGGHMSLPLQPPLVTSRRWSMVIWPRRTQQEEDRLTVCLLCKSMVKQILRTKGYNTRM